LTEAAVERHEVMGGGCERNTARAGGPRLLSAASDGPARCGLRIGGSSSRHRHLRVRWRGPAECV